MPGTVRMRETEGRTVVPRGWVGVGELVVKGQSYKMTSCGNGW